MAGRQASSLRIADMAVPVLLGAHLVFRLLLRGFSNLELRDHWAPLLGKASGDVTSDQMIYHLPLPRLQSLIRWILGTEGYRVTRLGWRAAMLLAPGGQPNLTTASPRSFPSKFWTTPNRTAASTPSIK